MNELKYHIHTIKREYLNADGKVLYVAVAKVIYADSTKDIAFRKRYSQRALRSVTVPCELCGASSRITKHHLVPVSVTEKRRARDKNVAYLCETCHKLVHKIFSNEELAESYNTVEALKRVPRWSNKGGRSIASQCDRLQTGRSRVQISPSPLTRPGSSSS